MQSSMVEATVQLGAILKESEEMQIEVERGLRGAKWAAKRISFRSDHRRRDNAHLHGIRAVDQAGESIGEKRG